MQNYRLVSLRDHGIAFDTETHLVQPGLLAPPIVCGSAGWWAHGPRIEGAILDKEQSVELFVQTLEDPDAVLLTANGPYDLLVGANECAKRGIDAMPLIYNALDGGRVYDLQTAEALHAIANGHLGKDPRNGGPLINPETGRRGRYSLATCTDLVLGRKDAKENDAWRLRYAELDGTPMNEWPQEAIDYPVDDAKNTAEVCLAQAGHLPKTSPHHNWSQKGVCLDCGADALGIQCLTTRRHRNLHDLSNQVMTHYVMHSGAAWGFKVDQEAADVIEKYSMRNKQRGLKPFTDGGLVREKDGTEDRSAIKRMVATAYGAKDPCPVCLGTGKVPSPKNPKTKIICFKMIEEGGVQVKGKTCDGTGYLLVGDVPRSEKEGVGYGRDVLHESGDEFLMSYADYLEDAKTLNVYIPFLRTARSCTVCGRAGTDADPHTCTESEYVYKNIPLTLKPNVMLETGRTSYDGCIQLFPRKPGHYDNETGEWVPSLRECIMARPGFVFSSEDYEAGEMITHAQSCLWLTGHSALAKALLNDFKPHNALAATMIGMTYAEFEARKNEKNCVNARQAAKPPNFGYPGGMGPVKLVHQQRKQGPDTPHASGPNMIKDEDGKLVPGYKGLRFCILMDGAPQCGGPGNMSREHNDRPIAPTCTHCIECAARLKEVWLRQWPENEDYFKLINSYVKKGMLIDHDMLRRWPHLAEVYKPNTQLAPGEIMQHFSGRIRGDIDYCSAANGFFQALLADACKSALRRVGRECYVRGTKVPMMAHANSLTSAFAGMESPLFGSRPIVFAHDELILEHPEAIAHEAATRTSEIMVEELRWYCPDMAKACAAEPTLMRRWYKGAKKVVVNGRMVPWEPRA